MSCKHIFSSCLASLAPRRSRMWKEGKKVHERTAAAVEVFYVLWSILKASEAPLFYERGTQPLNTPYDALREILHRCRLASKLRLAVDWARCLFFLTFGSNPKIQGAKISFEAKKSLLSTFYNCDNCWWWQDDLAIFAFFTVFENHQKCLIFKLKTIFIVFLNVSIFPPKCFLSRQKSWEMWTTIGQITLRLNIWGN